MSNINKKYLKDKIRWINELVESSDSEIASLELYDLLEYVRRGGNRV